VQVVRQVVWAALQARPPGQAEVIGAGQAPAAQLAAAVIVAPAQLAGRHEVVGYVQSLGDDAHEPAHTVPAPAQSPPWWGWPPVSCAQWPSVAVTSQAWQRPVQSASQHTPSAQ
jgi:hypothetical protein